MAGLERFLRRKRDRKLLRVLRPANTRKPGFIYFDGKEYSDFSSNDYLGLSNHPKIKNASLAAAREFGTGSSASRLLSGDSRLYHKLEEKVASFKGKEAALVFNSGYQANIGIISSLCGRGDGIFSDKLNHASIIDGILLSGARLFRFRHNDAGHLEELLKKERPAVKEALIVTESVFSMEGDRPPIKDMVYLKKKYGCALMVDEAHATGVFGKGGSGVIEEEGFTGDVDLVMGTFGKALGSFGAYAASNRTTIDYLINFCRSFIYSTALPAHVIAANLAAMEVVKEEPGRRAALLENAAFFRKRLREEGLNIRGSSQIVPLITGGVEKSGMLCRTLRESGFWSLAIRPPAVPSGEARLRFSLSYSHTKDILKGLIDVILEFYKV